MKYRRLEDRGRVFLDESEEEIKLLDSVYKCNDNDVEGINKLLIKLSIIEHARLLAYLDKHSPGKKFDIYCNYFDEISQLLKERIRNSLEEALRTSIPAKVTWFGKIDTFEVEDMIENILKKVMRPSPEVLRYIDLSNKILKSFNINQMKIIVENEEGKAQIIDLKNKTVIWEGSNVKTMYLNDTGKVKIWYQNGIAELIDLENENAILFKGENVLTMNLNSKTETKLAVLYEDGKGKVIDLEHNNVILFEANNVSTIGLNAAGTIVIILCKCNPDTQSGKEGAIDLEHENTILLEEDNVKDIEIVNSLNASNNILLNYADTDDTTKIIIFKKGEKNGTTVLEEKNIEWREFDPFLTKIAIWGKDGNGKVINLKNGRTIFKTSNVDRMDLNSKGTRCLIEYKNDKRTIINLENGKIVWQEHGIKKTNFSLDKITIVYYKNGSGKIVDLENGRTIFKASNVKNITLESIELSMVKYEDGSQEIIDLKNKIVLFKENNPTAHIRYNPTSMEAAVLYEDNSKKGIILINLLKDYKNKLIFTKLNLKNLIYTFALSTTF